MMMMGIWNNSATRVNLNKLKLWLDSDKIGSITSVDSSKSPLSVDTLPLTIICMHDLALFLINFQTIREYALKLNIDNNIDIDNDTNSSR